MLSAFISSLRTPRSQAQILFTLGLVVLYRAGATAAAVAGRELPQRQPDCIQRVMGSDSGQFYGLINLSGGALLQTVFAVDIMPTSRPASSLRLLGVVIPRFEQLRKEGQAGRAE